MSFDPSSATPEPTFDPSSAALDTGPSPKDVARAAVPTNPDQAAAAAKLAKKYNAPDEVLLRNLQDVQVQDAVNEYSKKLAAAPVLADYMRKSPFVAKQSHDDIDALTQVNSSIGALSAASLGQAVLGLSESLWRIPDAAQRLVGNVASVVEQTGLSPNLNPIRGVQDVLQFLSEGQLPIGPKLFEGTTDFANRVNSAQEILTKDTAAFGETFAGVQALGKNADTALKTAVSTGDLRQLGQVVFDPRYWTTAVAQAAPSLLTSYLSGGSLAVIGGLEALEQANNVAEYEQRTGTKISDAQFTQAVAQTALINGALEKAGLDKVLGARGKGLSGILRAMAGEGGTEGLQQINSNLAAWLAYDENKNLLEGVLSSVMGGVGAGGSMATVSAAGDTMQRMVAQRQQQNANAQGDAQRLAAAMQAATTSKLRERNPETFAQLVQHIAENTDGAPQSVYIDAQVLNQSGVDIATVLPGVAEQMEAALAANGTVEVSIAEALANLPGTPLEQVFLQNARSAPDALSLADAEQQGAQAAEFIKNEADRVLQQAQDQAAWQTSSDAVRTTILDQLNQAGRFTPEVNEAYALLQANFFSTMAARTGVTPQEMYDRFSLKVAAEQNAADASSELEGWEAFRGGAAVDTYTVDAIRTNAKNAIDNGFGIYITADTGTADYYAERSSGVRNVLRVLAPKNSLLNRDLKLSEQTAFVVNSLRQLGLYEGNEDLSGKDLYDKLAATASGKKTGVSLKRGSNADAMKQANAVLESAGIRGMTYRADHTGNGVQEHYVIFNGNDLRNAPQQASTGQVLNSGTKPGEVTVEGYHFSMADRPLLSTEFFGRGLKGSARDEIMSHPDERIKQRLSFYVDLGKGILPETGVGGRAHRVQLSNIYDSDLDPLKLRAADARAFESKVLDAGYSGYLSRMGGASQGQVIMLGKQSFQPELLGPKARIEAGQRVEALPRQAPQWQVQASGTPEQLQARFDRMQSNPAWADYEMRIEGNELQVRKKGGVFEQSVSTRLPTAKKALENPLEDMLIIGLEAAKADPKAFEKNVELIRQYPNFRDNKSASTPDKAAEQFIKHVVDNLLWLHDQVPAETRERSKLWYDGARAIVDRWTPKYNVTDAQVAGMLAVLSPQKDWFQNVSLAERVLDIMTTKQDFAWSDEMSQTAASIGALNPEDVGEITGKTLGEIDSNYLQAVWVRVYDQTYNERGYRVVSPEGDFTDWVYNTDGTTKSKTAWGSFNEIGKAISIFKDGSLANISASLGEQHKVRNFYNNIFNPASQHGDVTIDTHAVAAGLLRPLSGSATEVLHNFGAGGAASSSVFGSKGTYGIYAEAYRRAAAERGVLAREMQSITWEAVRGLYTAGFKAQASNVAKIDAVWEQYKKRRISLDEARKQLLELSGGIAPPEWERPGAGASETAWASSYTGELRQDGGTDRTAGRGDRGVLAQSEPGGLTDGRPEQTGDRGGRYSSGSLAPLEGAPAVAGAAGPDPKLVAVAEQYARDNGIDLRRQDRFVEVDEARAARIAQAYAEMRHTPNDPKVKEAYDDLIRQTRAQYDALVGAGYQFTFFDNTGDPYGGNPWNAMRDLRANQRMAVYGTYAGFGVGAQVNIGLADPNGGDNLDPADVLQSLRDVGAEVEVSSVFSSDTEPTLVVKIKQALTKEQGDKVSEVLGQEAIAQRTDDEKGQLFGPMAEKWGPYNPSYFVTATGDRADAIANPLLQDTGLEWSDQNGEMRPVLANDLFRAVHDAFGHGLEGAGFRARGEENAWQAHVRLFTGPAVGAITSETRGQNSWLNYGPYGEKNRSAAVEDTVFAEQKTGLMPEWTWSEGRAGDMRDDVLEQGPRGTFNPQTLLISLNENANLSTFLHESGHFFLEVMADLAAQPDAPAQVREDMDKLLAWFGIKGDENVGGRDAGGELAQVVDQTQTPEFKAWFGDSKVRQAPTSSKQKFKDMPPLVVYHGTRSDFDTFAAVREGNVTTMLGDEETVTRRGIFFAESPDFAATFAKQSGEGSPRTMPVYLSIQNPLYLDEGFTDEIIDELREAGLPEEQAQRLRYRKAEMAWAEFDDEAGEAFVAAAKAAGYDGALMVEPGVGLEGEDQQNVWVAFDPAQIKSAIGNNGQFDPNNPSILAQDGNLPTDNTQPAGRTPLETWRAMTLDQKRQYHERFAESFEAYLLEGKAPSAELQPLFRRFRSWLVNVYKSLKEFMRGRDLNMNDEVRQVFDRMLATDEQIAAAEEAAGMLPDFDATNEAIEKLQARSLRDLKWTIGARSRALKALQKEAANLRKAVEAEVRAAVEATPEMQAKAALDNLRKQNKRAPSDIEIATVADSFGYPSVDAMLQAIDAFGPKKAAIEGMTDQRMLENFGELATPEAIEEAANDAVHNEARARALATELKTQAEALNPREDTGRTASNGRPVTVNALSAAAKQFAENLVARRKVKDLKNAAWQHRAAEARAGKAWQEATAKGKTQEAVQAKRDQMLNNYAAKAMGDAQAEVKKILDFFARVTKGNNEKTVERGRDPDVVNAARAILAAYEIAPRLEKGALEYLAVLKANDPTMYAALEPSIAGAVNNAKPVGEMSMEELRGLKDEIDAMWHLAKRSRQMEVDGNLLDIQDAADELQARMQEIGVPDTMPGDARAITKAEQRGRWLQHAGSLLRRAEQWAEGMDGKFGGPFLRLVFQPVKEAANRYRADRVKYRKAYQALVDQVAPSLRKGPIAAPEIGYTFGEGHNGIGHAELLHAILHTGNESNKRKLLLGRKWATENADGTLDTTQWDALINRLVNDGTLTQAHYDFAQGVWDLLEQTKPLAQKTHRDVFGRYFAEVTADEFIDPFGVQRRGGYVPAQADPRIVQDADLRKLAELENENMAYSFPATNKGFTKGRVEYNRPLLLDLRTIGQHIDKVLLFSHMEPAVRDVNKLLSQKGVSYSLGRIDPTIYAGMLTPWLSRSARQIVETPILGDGGISRVLSAARSRAGMALMFANVSNSIQQLSGFANAFAKLKADNLNSQMLRATAQFIASPREMSRSVAQASAFMNDRMENEIAAINDAMDAILLDPSLVERTQAWTQKHAYFLQTAFANTMEPIIWTAGYNAALEKGMSEKDAVRYADGLIRQTQGSTLPEDVSRIETGPAYGRIFTQFIGYFNMMANTSATGLKQISQDVGLRKGAGKALLLVTTGMLVPIWIAEAIAQAMRGGPDDEDDDGYLDDWLAAVFGMGTIKGTFAMVPFIGQFANVTLNKMNGNPADDRASLSPAVSLLEAGAGVPKLVYQAITDPDKVNARNAVRDVASALSIATGIPVYALSRPIGYLAGVADDKIEPTGPVDAVRGAVTGTPSEESRVR